MSLINRLMIAFLLFIVLLLPQSSYAESSDSPEAANPAAQTAEIYFSEHYIPADTVDSEFMIGAYVKSKYEVVRVTAQIEGVVLELKYGQNDICRRYGCFDWSGKMNISSLTRGVKKVTLIAVDSHGNKATRQFDLTYDKKPIIEVLAPKPKEVATPKLRIQARCKDDDTAKGCVSLSAWVGDQEIKAKDMIDQEVSLEHLDGKSKSISFKAKDSASQETDYTVNIYVESSDKLTRLDQVDGRILDISTDKMVYFREEARQLVLKYRSSGEETVIYTTTDSRYFEKAYLTSDGVIFGVNYDSGPARLWEWREGRLIDLGTMSQANSLNVKDGYALYVRLINPKNWRDGNILVLRDLKKGICQDIFTAKDIPNEGHDLTADGKVVFSAIESENRQIYQYENGTVTQITYDTDKKPYFPVTDGTLIVYMVKKNNGASIVVHSLGGKQLLSEVNYANPGKDYQVNNGWIAFTRENGQARQVWVRSPQGELRKLSDMNQEHSIAYVTGRGDVAFFNDTGLYLSENLASGRKDYIRISSTLVQPVWVQGQLFGKIYGTLFAIHAGTPDTSAPTWPAESRLDAAEVTSESVRLSWSPAQDDIAVTGYKVYQGSELVATVTGTTYTVTGLKPGTTYRFKVEAGDAAGHWSMTGPSVEATTKSAPVTDRMPPLIRQVQPADGQTVSESNLFVSAIITDDETGVDPASVTVKVDNRNLQAGYDAAAHAVTAAAYGLASGKHSLSISARDKAGNRADSETSFIVSSASQGPTWPEGSKLSASKIAATSLSLNWTPAEGAAGYRIYQEGSVVGTVYGHVYAYDVTGLRPSTAYTFSVQAWDAGGRFSSNNPIVSVTTGAYGTTELGRLQARPGFLNVGSVLELQVRADQATDVYAFLAKLQYDPAKFKLLQASLHPEFGTEGTTAVRGYYAPSPDRVHVSGSLLGKTPGRNGNVGLATLRFSVLQQGRGTFTLQPDSQLADSRGGVRTMPGPVSLTVHIGSADFDGDGRTGLSDLVLISQHSGTRTGQPEYDSLFDLNNDGVIDNTDVQYVADKVAALPLGR
ncbi:fibronectin type III domain-containing protein [Paenibacillus ehimensis]|uniref:fibronectin type III domain-containing protein n=1 Tax=Paenibacillus ehimensis TaxID=79264 RepID=UPI003D27FD95